MNNEPLVTAIITTYRRDKSIVSRAINSVLMQTYKNIELIVVDDNGFDSEYHTMVSDVVNSYGSDKIRFIANENNSGVQISRNRGIENAKGEYLALLDDDDEWLPNKIEEQVQVYRNDVKSLGIVYSWFYLITIDDNERESKSIIETPSYKSNEVVTQLLRGNFIGSNSFPLLKTSYVKEVGGYDINLPSSQDLDLWIRLSQVSEIYCIDKPLSKYYEHVGNRISNNYQKKIEGMYIFYNKYKDLIDKDPQSYIYIHTLIASSMVKEGEYRSAREILRRLYRDYSIRDLSFRSIGLYMKSYLLQWGLMKI